jgi:DNA polymerase-4
LLGTLSVKVRYADFDTHTHARSVSPTADEALLRPLALSLLRALWTRRAAVRLVGVTASGLVLPGPQLPLPFARPREPIAQALDAVRARFGYDAVRLGQLSPPRRPQG